MTAFHVVLNYSNGELPQMIVVIASEYSKALDKIKSAFPSCTSVSKISTTKTVLL